MNKTTYDIIISTRVSKSDYETLCEISKSSYGVPVSTLVRVAVSEFIERREEDGK